MVDTDAETTVAIRPTSNVTIQNIAVAAHLAKFCNSAWNTNPTFIKLLFKTAVDLNTNYEIKPAFCKACIMLCYQILGVIAS
jgi:hypothetical protein